MNVEYMNSPLELKSLKTKYMQMIPLLYMIHKVVLFDLYLI